MPHASSDHRWTVIPRIREESSSRCVLPSDLFSFPFITFTAKVRDKELDHPFLLTFCAIIYAVKRLRFCNTNLHSRMSYFPSPILIWDPCSFDFWGHGLKPNTLRRRCFWWAMECYDVMKQHTQEHNTRGLQLDKEETSTTHRAKRKTSRKILNQLWS